MLVSFSTLLLAGCGGTGRITQPEFGEGLNAPIGAQPDNSDNSFDTGSDKATSAAFHKFYLDVVNQYSAGRWSVENLSGRKAFVLSDFFDSAPNAWIIGQNYWNSESDTLTTNAFTIPAHIANDGTNTRGIRLSFMSTWKIAAGDSAKVQYSINSGPWITLDTYTAGQSPAFPSWTKYYYELPDNLSGQEQSWKVRYNFASNLSLNNWGFGVDTVSVYQRELEVPANVSATDLDSSIQRQIRISWDPSVDQLAPVSYTISRATSQQGPYTFLTTINDPVNTTSYLDTPPETVTTYWYQVVAHKAGWLVSIASVATDGQAATTATVVLGEADHMGASGGGAGMTNEGIFTVVNGDISTTAASTTITGFHDTGGDIYTETPLNVGTVNGEIYSAPPAPGTLVQFTIATQAATDAQAAYDNISPAQLPGGIDPGAGELGGLTLLPGVYKAAGGTFQITGSDLTLDAQGDPNAVWVFQCASSLTVGDVAPRSITLSGGALAKNVYWYVGSAATINSAGGGTMVGTILADAGVTFSTAGNVTLTTLEGRAIGLNASVTLVNTIINVPQ